MEGRGWRLLSQALRLELRAEAHRLRFFDRATGQYLLSPAEEAQARREAETRAEQNATARRELESEVEQLKAELRRLRGEAG
jgi:hypothetical protein